MRLWAAPRLFLNVPGGQQQPGVEDLVRRTRIYAGHLFDQMERMGQTFGWQSWEQPDGSRVTVVCHGDFDTGFVQARIDVAGGTPVEVLLAYIEHGLLVWNPYAPEYPLQVYTDDALQGYLIGSGTAITATRDDHVWGYATELVGESCATGSSGVQWKDPLPTLGTDGEYLSRAFINSYPPAGSGVWTGLARGMDQCQKSWADLLPTGTDIDPTRIGVIRCPTDGNYWLVKVAIEAYRPRMWVAPLTAHPAWECLRARLIAGEYVGQTALLVESALLGACQKSTNEWTSLDIALPGSTESTPPLFDVPGADISGISAAAILAHGFQWDWQSSYTDTGGWVVSVYWTAPEGDGIVAYSRIGQGVIVWDGVTPLRCDVDEGNSVRWGHGRLRIGDAADNGSMLVDSAAWSTTATGLSGGLVYVWTTRAGIGALTVTAPAAGSWGPDTRPGTWGTWPLYSGGNGSKDSAYARSVGWTAGLSGSTADASAPILSEHYYLARELSPSGGGSVYLADDVVGLNVVVYWFHPYGILQHCTITEGSSVTINCHDMLAREDGEHKWGGSGDIGAAILGSDTGVAVYRRQNWTNQHLWNGEEITPDKPVSVSSSCISLTDYYCRPSGGGNQGIWAVRNNGTGEVGYRNAGYVLPTVTNEYPGTGTDIIAKVIGSDGVVRNIDHDDWDGISGATGNAALPYMHIAWGGREAVIWTEQYGVRHGPEGLAETARDSTYSAWRGCM